MGTNSGIEWTDHTWNIAVGCDWTSPECDNCYMFAGMRRVGRDPEVVQRTQPGTFRAPLARDRRGAWKWADGARVFTSSYTDFFHQDIDGFRAEAWDIMRLRPGLTFQVLTKRADRILDHLPPDWGGGWPNVWIGVTAGNQASADERIPHLLRVPAAVRFLSCEPLLGPVDLSKWTDFPFHRVTGSDAAGWALDEDPLLRVFDTAADARDAAPVDEGAWWEEEPGDWLASRPPRHIHWVVAGSESGPRRRPTDDDWFRSLRDQCRDAGVPFFLKQAARDGQIVSLPELDGHTWDEFPAAPVAEPAKETHRA